MIFYFILAGSLSLEEKMEVDARSVYVGNVSRDFLRVVA